ncbi:P-loop NTPase fold protein [Pseudomonas putida]|uniref:P-loop NTPase fold protein n=1 Tax=Pseudomonas putida TaxID=303 RepID=UPI000E0D9600|nr:P-loop NTPase fold protein [Pseudomonas putida]MCI1037728.1 hypothetical protein [Pseudomonas putida]WQE52216.1 P-loop NTPase fold protein [Pseudomonas putida]GLO03017.1 hypothetical protein PPUJ13061_29150 [Pseudomonas putida]HDS1005724.1 hypothetical protein [Pseudomonas putida]
MTIARCKTALLELLNDQENRVIALSGKWGTGKTELWKQVRAETRDAKAKQAVSVSLFGVSSITELKLKIAEGLAPKLGEKHFDSIKAGVAGFKKVLKGFHSSFSALDELSLLAVPYMLKGRFIVIDDVERKHAKLTIDEILGFIDECVQNHECRILLVLNSDKLKDQDIWIEIREKVVDQEIKLETSPSEAFDIAQKLMPCPWPESLKAALEPLQITNIRILRKIIRAAKQLLGQDPSLPNLVLNRVLPSISLLSAIHHEAVEDAPSLEFILGYEGSKSATLIALRKNQSEPLTEEQKKHDRWHQLMNQLGIAEADDLEGLILAFLDSGVMDTPKIRDVVRDYLQRGERLEARRKAIVFKSHFDWHPELSDQDLIEELHALLPSAGLLHMGILSRLIPVIDQLSGEQTLGLAFIDAWRAEFRAQNPHGITEEWLKVNRRFRDHLHPLIQAEVDAARAKAGTHFTFLSICQELMKGRDWSASEKQFVRSMGVQDFEKEIRTASGQGLQLLMYKGFELVNSPRGPLGDYGNAPQAFVQACHNIVVQEPFSRLAMIIKRETTAAGADAQLRGDIEAEHGVDLALIPGP